MKRSSAERGATLVEYSLVLVAVVVVSIVAVNFMTSAGNSQIDNQANCVSTRPPPPSCQIVAITTTTSTTTPPASTTTAPPITTTTTTPPVTQSSTIGWTTSTTSTSWQVTSSVILQASPGSTPVVGATVVFQFQVNAPAGTQTVFGTCTSDAAGLCSVTQEAVFTDATTITVSVESIDSDPANLSLPGPVTVPKP